MKSKTINTDGEIPNKRTQNTFRKSNEENRIAEEFKVFIGGYAQTVERDHPIDNRVQLERESIAIEQWAREKGYFIENLSDIYFATDYGGAECELYIDTNDTNIIIKDMNPGVYNGYAGILGRLEMHNSFFPETAYTLIGFTKEGNVLNLVLKQSFVKNARNATQQEIFDYLTAMAFKVEDSVTGNYVWKNDDKVTIGDMHTGNALTTEDGTVIIIDPMIEYDGEAPLYDYISVG
jgi:hypothetical protein